jgi:serine/threonine protein kinase
MDGFALSDGQLGAGGTGVVYRAGDARLGGSVALTFLPEELAQDEEAVRGLRAEARALVRVEPRQHLRDLRHRRGPGRPFIVMELLKGQNLRGWPPAR